MGLAKWTAIRLCVEAGFKPEKNDPILLGEGAKGEDTWVLGEEEGMRAGAGEGNGWIAVSTMQYRKLRQHSADPPY